MEKYGREHLLSYLEKTCENAYLRALIVEYYDKLAQKNITVPLEKFEKIHILSEDSIASFTPDVVRFCKDKKSVALHELLVCQLINRINKISLVDDARFNGYIDLSTNQIFIQKTPRAQVRELIEARYGCSKVNINEVTDYILGENYRHILFHELSHLLEMKFYADGTIVNIGLENRCVVRRGDQIVNVEKCGHRPPYDVGYGAFEILANQGALQISEMFNEFFTAEVVDWQLQLRQAPVAVKERYGLEQYLVYPLKYGPAVENEYLKLFKTFEFLGSVTKQKFDFNDVRLNSDKFVFAVNSVLSQSEQEQLVSDVQSKINVDIPRDASLFDLICFNVGVVRHGVYYNQNNISRVGMEFNDALFERVYQIMGNKQKLTTKRPISSAACLKNCSELEK